MAPIVERRLYKAVKPIEFVKTAAGYLIEEAQAKLEKQRLDPLGACENHFHQASAMLEAEAHRAITETNSYLNINTEAFIAQTRFTVGASPGLVEDIVKGITKPIADIVDLALEPIDKAIEDAETLILSQIFSVINGVKGAISSIETVIDSAIAASAAVVNTAIEGVKTAVNGILDGVAAILSPLITALSSAFSALLTKITELFTFDVKDIFALQQDLQKMGMKEMAKTVTNLAQGA